MAIPWERLGGLGAALWSIITQIYFKILHVVPCAYIPWK